MHGLDLILTLTTALAVALVFGYITQWLGLSTIVGYLLAGIAVGPHTPGFVADQAIAEQLAEVGVILLMFGVGLQFHPKELLAVRRIAVPGAIAQSLVATVLGAVVAHSIGWSWSAGIVFGLAISVASTVVLMRALTDNRDLHTPAGHIAVGWLIVEDLFTVVVLVLMPTLFGGEAQALGSIPYALAAAVVQVAILVAAVFVVGGRVIPWLLQRVAATHSRELFTLTVLIMALGIAVGSAKVFGVTMALGAFLAGMVVGRSEFSLRAASDALPMRDAFAVLFFVSVGLLFEPAFLLAAPGLIAAALVIILVGKPLAALAIALGMGYPLKTSMSVAIALAQIGEFSFIVSTVGRELNILPPELTNTLVAAAIISISVNPLLYRAADPLAAWLLRNVRLGRLFKRFWRVRRPDIPSQQLQPATPSRYRAVVIGFGPVGRTLVRLLKENEVEPTVIDLNFDAVQAARRQGIQAAYGDATQRESLKAAGVAESDTLILSASNLTASAEVIRMAKELNPEIRVLARGTYVSQLRPLKQAGANLVFSGEGEVALALTVAVLGELGATAEQIDRERERVRRELVEVRDGDVDITAPRAPTPDKRTSKENGTSKE